MRKYEGLLSEEDEKYLSMFDSMSYEEIIEYHKTHLNPLNESVQSVDDIPYLDMTVEELCEKYNLVNKTNFFVNNGVKLPDI